MRCTCQHLQCRSLFPLAATRVAPSLRGRSRSRLPVFSPFGRRFLAVRSSSCLPVRSIYVASAVSCVFDSSCRSVKYWVAASSSLDLHRACPLSLKFQSCLPPHQAFIARTLYSSPTVPVVKSTWVAPVFFCASNSSFQLVEFWIVPSWSLEIDRAFFVARLGLYHPHSTHVQSSFPIDLQIRSYLS